MEIMKAENAERFQVHIRWMIRRDFAEVLAIEAEAFEFPWSGEDFTRVLLRRNAIGMVAERGDRVVGFMVYEVTESKIHLLNFAVAAGCRRHGIGRQMAANLVGKLGGNRRRVILEVRERNINAQLFWGAMGFRAIKIVRGHWDHVETDEDAYRFRYRLAMDQNRTAAR